MGTSTSNSSPSPEESGPFLGETRQRICPHCRSTDVIPLKRLVANSTGIRIEYRCQACAKEFMLLR
jgi:hypothetical protein